MVDDRAELVGGGEFPDDDSHLLLQTKGWMIPMACCLIWEASWRTQMLACGHEGACRCDHLAGHHHMPQLLGPWAWECIAGHHGRMQAGKLMDVQLTSMAIHSRSLLEASGWGRIEGIL